MKYEIRNIFFVNFSFCFEQTNNRLISKKEKCIKTGEEKETLCYWMLEKRSGRFLRLLNERRVMHEV